MEAMQLLTVVLAALAVLAAHRRRRTGHVQANRTMPIMEVGDADAARRMIIDHADSFSNHPTVPLAVDFDAGHSRTHSITTAPYGPLWRALRSNLTANIVHPSRLSHLVAVQRRAAEALVADLSPSARRAGEVVVVRDMVYAAVFTTAVRMCLGDGVGERDARAIRSALREFFHSNIDANLLARSWPARLLHWRQWRYLVGTRRRLAGLFAPVIAARRQSRCSSGDDGGGSSSYLDSLLDLRIPDIDAGPDGGEIAGSRRRALRDDEVVRLVWEVMGSSTEVITACIEWTLARLVTEPEVQKKLYHELAAGDQDRLQDTPYLRAVILETLRLHPPLPLVVREVGPQGAAVAGATPPPDDTPTRFFFNTEEMGRDPKKWTDPDEFKPERFLAGGEGEDVSPVPGPKEMKIMPFGAGRRHCPGAALSMMQVSCFVAALVREFEWAPPADGGGVGRTAITALFVKVMAPPLRASITPRTADQ